ncbi:vanadium-dependent haloperoxidase [Membranihabitans marinus]|uniref:vanadium-dependent haloperoxidase n=1 Tax=Membranihabitans marinus TaxID=1227546 RepID=UPI001F1DFD9D|nr:vanadium-dependent haloperoxidase [Membranihabitans marinus]
MKNNRYFMLKPSKLRHFSYGAVLIFILITLESCQKENIDSPTSVGVSPLTREYEGEFLQDYFFLTCRIAQTTDGFFPTQAARAYGYIGVTAYESVVHGIEGGESLAGQLDGFEKGSLPQPNPALEYNWALACNAAMGQIIRRSFELNLTNENSERLYFMEKDNRNLLSQNVPEDVIMRSEHFGRSVAEAIYQKSTTDGAHLAYLDPFKQSEAIPNDEYCWVPTGANAVPLSPNWDKTRSFIPNIAEDSQPIPHLAFSKETNSEFYQQAMDVYTQVTQNNTEEEITIAKYWADDPFQTCTPAGHTFNITTQLLQESNATLEKTAVGLGMMAVAENDAFISCWKSKYDYVLIRPVSYIQRYIDSDFQTVIGTPPFPAYISGHSAEIGAGIKVLIELFADENGNYEFTDLSQIQYGFEARQYDNFYDMAAECALSRYYGGIHFEMDNTNGLDVGYAVGDAVLTKINWPKNIQ